MSGNHRYQIKPYGDAGVLVEFSKKYTKEAWQNAHYFAKQLRENNIRGILGVIPTYTTVFISFDCLIVSRRYIIEFIHEFLEKKPTTVSEEPIQIFRIPVLFGDNWGPDLPYVAEHLGVSENEVVKRFLASGLQIMCVNRGPMFGSNFSKEIPRLETPRTKVPAGSVTVGGSQTSIMTQESPGGWRILGQTPVKMELNYLIDPPVPYNPGDVIEFYEIQEEDFCKYEGKTMSEMKVQP